MVRLVPKRLQAQPALLARRHSSQPLDPVSANQPLFAIGRPAWMTGSLEHDWPEDASHENGNYFCKCSNCGCDFIGHKRRHTCKRCHVDLLAEYEAMKDEDKREWEAERMADIATIWPTIHP